MNSRTNNLHRRLFASCLLLPLIFWNAAGFAQQRNAVLHWRNGDSLPGSFLESQSEQIRWKSPVFLDEVRVNASDLTSVVFPVSGGDVSIQSDGAFRVATTSGDVFTADLIGADSKTFTMSNERLGKFTIARPAIYSLIRHNNPNMIFDGSQFDDWEIRTTDLWQREPAGHAITQKTGSTLFHKANLPKQFELELELVASAAPKFVLAFAKDKAAAADPGTLRLETWDDQVVLLQNQIKDDLFEPIITIGKGQRDVRLRLAYDGETGELQVSDASGRRLATAKNAHVATGDSGIIVRNRGKDLTIQRLVLNRQVKSRSQNPIDYQKPRVHLLDGSVLYGSLSNIERGLIVLNGDRQRKIDLNQIDRIETPGVQLTVTSDASEMRYADGAVLRGQVQQTSPSHVTLRTAFSDVPIPCAITNALSLRFPLTNKVASPDGLPNQDLDIMKFDSGSLVGLLQFDSANSTLRWKRLGIDNPLRLSARGRAIIERSARNANKEGISFDANTFPHLIHLHTGEVIPCRVSSCDMDSLDFQSPFLRTQTLKRSHLKTIEFTEDFRNSIDFEKLRRALTVPRFNRDSPPSHIFVANNGDLKRGSLVGIKGNAVDFESKLRKSSVPIERIARVVNVEKPESATVQSTSSEASEFRFKLADGSILRFEPVKVMNGQLIGRSTIYGEVSIPIVNIVELQIGDFEDNGFTSLFSDWVVRSGKEPQFGKTP